MALETFGWRTQIQSGMEGSYTHRAREVQFGDGYTQIAGDGINQETQSWPVSMAGRVREMAPALAFIRRHVIHSFIWTPPFGVPGLYRVVKDSVKSSPLSNNAMTISATFIQAYHP